MSGCPLKVFSFLFNFRLFWAVSFTYGGLEGALGKEEVVRPSEKRGLVSRVLVILFAPLRRRFLSYLDDAAALGIGFATVE